VNTKNPRRSESRLINSILIGALISLAAQSVLNIFLLAGEHAGRADVSRIGVVSFIATTCLGFLVVLKRHSGWQVFAVGVVYFPALFMMMFFEVLYVEARIYRSIF